VSPAPQDSRALSSAPGAIFAEPREKTWAGPVDQATQALDGLLTMADSPPADEQGLQLGPEDDQGLQLGPEVPQVSPAARTEVQVSSQLPRGASCPCLLDGMAALHLQDVPIDDAALGANLGGQQASVPASIHASATPAHAGGDLGIPRRVYSRRRVAHGAAAVPAPQPVVASTTTFKQHQLTNNSQQEQTCTDVVASALSLGLSAPPTVDGISSAPSNVALEGQQQPPQLLAPATTYAEEHDATTQPAPQPLSSRDGFINKITAHTAAILPIKIQHRRAKALQQRQTPRRSRRIAGAAVEFKPGDLERRSKKKVMRSLKIIGEQEGIDQQAQEEYVKLFEEPLSDSHVQALAALFKWNIPVALMQEEDGMPTL
jgi:hypothetical protein